MTDEPLGPSESQRMIDWLQRELDHQRELNGEMRRALTVLKMRGSMHNKDICEFNIDQQGMHIGRPFRNVIGILTGNPHISTPSEMERLDELFRAQ